MRIEGNVHNSRGAENYCFLQISQNAVCLEERRERNASYCREFIVLPGSCVSVWTHTSTHRQFIILLIYSSKFHSKPDFFIKRLYPDILFAMLFQ